MLLHPSMLVPEHQRSIMLQPLCICQLGARLRRWRLQRLVLGREALGCHWRSPAAVRNPRLSAGCVAEHPFMVPLHRVHACSYRYKSQAPPAYPSASAKRSVPAGPGATYPLRPRRSCTCCHASWRGGAHSGARPATCTTCSPAASSSTLASESTAGGEDHAGSLGRGKRNETSRPERWARAKQRAREPCLCPC